MMGALFYREGVLPWMQGGSLPPRPNKAVDLWLGIYAGGGEQRVGFLNARSTPEWKEGEAGTSMSLTAQVELPILGKSTGFSLRGSGWSRGNGGLTDFDLAFKTGEHEMRVEGKVAEGRLRAQLHTGGEVMPLDFPVKSELLLSGGMGMSAFDVPLLEPGKELTVDAFDPMTMSVGKAKVACVGKEFLEEAGQRTEAFVITTTVSGITSKAWVNAAGDVLRVDTPFGFSLKRITPAEALLPTHAQDTADLIQNFAVHPSGMTPKRGAAIMQVHFTGLDEHNLPPSDALQTRTPGGYVITQAEPPSSKAEAALSAEDRAAALASDPFVSSDHPKIREMAATIVDDEQDPWKKAVRIHDWVFSNLKKKMTLSLPSALDVLQTREGDCNEHAVLYTALARAAGIPTRIAIGLVWGESINAFAYHAWVEVFAGEWIPMDPTFGQPVADATHIKLLTGSIDQWPRLLPYMGNMRIEVLNVQ